MISIIRYTMITALRDFLFIGLLGLILVAMFISHFLGNTALVEQNQMTLSYMGSITRLILITGLILFVCFHVRRSFDNKEIEVILSKSISRTKFITSYWLAFAILSLIVTIPVTILICGFAETNHSGLLFWSISLMLEGLMMVAFAMLSALIMNSAVTSALSSLGFYFISRMMGFFVATIYNRPGQVTLSFDNFTWGNSLNWLSEQILVLCSTLLPRLDLFGKTSWLIYGISDKKELVIFFLQSIIYIPLLLAVANFDFKRKQF